MNISIQYEGWDINLRLKPKSFGFRLWSYFVLFTAFIFTILWLLQTVFLQSFYDSMIISNTKNAAENIISDGKNENINDIIDELSHKNSVLVFVTDTDGNILYTSDEFSGMRKRGFNEENNEMKTRKADKHSGGYRSLPNNYSEFLEKLSENNIVEIRSENYYVYGSYMDYYRTEEKAVLYIGAVIDAVGASVTIISMQLVWVTVLSVIAGFVLSWFMSRRFSVPVAHLSQKAKLLGEKKYSPEFKKGFCTELDELSDTLDKTNEKLNESRAFQTELLANVSHDLRTPLTMIKGYAEMIRDISWEDEKQCSEDVAVIIKEADRLTALVNEIMEYSELKSDGRKEDFTKTDLSSLVKMTAVSFENLKKPDGITVEKNIQENIFINGSESRLERALYNLMDNAARYTDDSKKINISLSSENGRAVISVRDYGSGIPENELEHIWDRYYTTRMRKGKGVSGLGLAIVRQIAQMHGGNCYARSEHGNGSIFIIDLPA